MHENFFNYITHKNASDDTRIYRLWLHIAHQLHTLFCECVAIPETSFIIKELEIARTARDYTMHFVVLYQGNFQAIILQSFVV